MLLVGLGDEAAAVGLESVLATAYVVEAEAAIGAGHHLLCPVAVFAGRDGHFHTGERLVRGGTYHRSTDAEFLRRCWTPRSVLLGVPELPQARENHEHGDEPSLHVSLPHRHPFEIHFGPLAG